ncbi:DUF3558 family protein [Rhodococcoides yunnanense]|uniref:DUF3558 family protein n=1 Tax=Rhodococcoides yunnanense TaxID=278209 RepID=UPI001FE78F0E|nr:DUF3558 family protein [Rhodococcus yunnanensis]
MRKWVVALIAGAVVLEGCGGGVEGSPIAVERWDPCSITPEALAATGLDPEYRMEGWGEGIDVPDWGSCVFHAPGGVDSAYGLSVMSSTDHTIAEARAKQSNREGRDSKIGGRDAYTYRTEFGVAIRDCQIALEVPGGVVVFTALYRIDDGVDACQVVLDHVTDLESAVPAAPK